MKINLTCLVAFVLIINVSCKKEEPKKVEPKQGCMDVAATNYDATANENCCCNYTVAPPPLTSDFAPPSGLGVSTDTQSPAYFRLVKATSADGITYTTSNVLITDQGNTPNFILKDNKLFLYYTGWALGTVTNVIGCAVSQDYGQTWAYKNCNFSGFGTGVKPVDPDPILLPNGTIRMFATTNIGPRRAIVCYESTDGLNFNFVDTAAYSPVNDIFDSNTFQLNGNWHMYCINGSNPVHWYLTSSNGINFNVSSTKTFLDGTNQHFLGKGYVVGTDYKAFTTFLPGQSVKSFSTNNGSTWAVEPGFRITYGGSTLEHTYLKDPAAIKLPNNTYLMAYVTRIQ